MVLIDTSIWIDYFQKPSTPEAKELVKLIQPVNQAILCGIVIQEILQGIRDDESYALTKERLQYFPLISTDRETYISAASIYRSLRVKAITPSSTDTLIAAISIQNNLPLFTKDKLFKSIAKNTDLQLHSIT